MGHDEVSRAMKIRTLVTLNGRRHERHKCVCYLMRPRYYPYQKFDAIICSVKKLILILLLVILPFQFSWAVAGAYCQHEQGKTSQHFGHHAHQHQAKADVPDAKGEMGKLHTDCSSCHGAGCVVFAVAHPTPGVLPVVRDYVEPLPISYTSHIPDGPRRPDRLPVA